MSRLFLRIWLWFWLAMILLGTALFIAQRQWADDAMPGMSYRDRLVHVLGRAGVEILQGSGEQALLRWRRDLEQDLSGRLYLFDPHGKEFTGQHIPEHVQNRLTRRSDPANAQRRREGGRLVVAELGKGYRAVAFFPPRSKHRLFLPLWLRALIAVTVTGLVCLALARWLTHPVRVVRDASRRLANGELSVRIAGSIRRRDELGALAQDFDRMAEHLERLMSAQTRLLRDVSHELRSPLARLQVALALARRESGPRAIEALDRIAREADRLNELIGQVLALARYESGDIAPRELPLNLAEVTARVVQDAGFEARLRKRCVRLVAPLFAPCVGDAGLLLSALENVVRNAVRHTAPDTEVTVTIARQGGNWQVTVRDCGPGVPEADLERLFQPFVRIGEARDRDSGGYGLGLAIAHRAITLHGGRIGATNVRGGLAITIDLPARRPDQRTDIR